MYAGTEIKNTIYNEITQTHRNKVFSFSICTWDFSSYILCKQRKVFAIENRCRIYAWHFNACSVKSSILDFVFGFQCVKNFVYVELPKECYNASVLLFHFRNELTFDTGRSKCTRFEFAHVCTQSIFLIVSLFYISTSYSHPSFSVK